MRTFLSTNPQSQSNFTQQIKSKTHITIPSDLWITQITNRVMEDAFGRDSHVSSLLSTGFTIIHNNTTRRCYLKKFMKWVMSLSSPRSDACSAKIIVWRPWCETLLSSWKRTTDLNNRDTCGESLRRYSHSCHKWPRDGLLEKSHQVQAQSDGQLGWRCPYYDVIQFRGASTKAWESRNL